MINTYKTKNLSQQLRIFYKSFWKQSKIIYYVANCINNPKILKRYKKRIEDVQWFNSKVNR